MCLANVNRKKFRGLYENNKSFIVIFINFPEKSGTVCTRWGRKAKHVGHGKGVRDGEYKIQEGAS